MALKLIGFNFRNSLKVIKTLKITCPRAIVIKFLTIVWFEKGKYIRVFALNRPLKLSLMFASKVRSPPEVRKVLHFRVGSEALKKTYQEQTVQLIWPICL
jgi:hypothetical protein